MSPKKQHIINTAMKMFYANGIHAVGINEILKESGVAKKTLYHHFSGKEQLIVETLIQRDKNFVTWFEGRLNEVSPGRDALLHVFSALDDWFKSNTGILGDFRGCFFVNVSAEYSENDSEIFQQCSKHKKQIRALILSHTEILCQDKEKATELADMICVLKEGCINTAFVQQNLDIAKRLLPSIISFVNQYSSAQLK